MDNALILERVLNLILLLLSLTFHEFFHAWSAWRLGDDTAARMGRLTLNPIAHIDPVGTLLLPLLGAPIGWAKPVPVNPSRCRRGVSMSTGDILVSAAGPASNLLLALIAAVALGLLARFAPSAVEPGSAPLSLLHGLIYLNAGLALFNILPIPPLDGSHVVGNLVPYRFRGAWEQFQSLAPFLLIGLVVFGRGLIGPPIAFVGDLFWRVATTIAA